MNKKAKKAPDNMIANNRKAFHDYFIEQKLEAGVSLKGWEVKSIRAGRTQLKEAYVLIRKGEAWLLGAHIMPLSSASTHVETDPTRTRKLLLHQEELHKLIGKVEQQGYTIVPLRLYWKKSLVKCEIGLAKGKKLHDKRQTQKEKDWARQKQRILKNG